MRIDFFLVAFLYSTVAMAHVWKSEDDSYVLKTSKDDGFTLIVNGVTHACKVWYWPARNPEGLLKCEDGGTATIELVDDNEIIIDRITLRKILNN